MTPGGWLGCLSGTASEVRNQFLEPLSAVYDRATTLRNCPGESDWDWLTRGVDRVVTDRRGIRVREIAFQNPCDGQVYVYLTSEMTLKPGLLALLYKTR